MGVNLDYQAMPLTMLNKMVESNMEVYTCTKQHLYPLDVITIKKVWPLILLVELLIYNLKMKTLYYRQLLQLVQLLSYFKLRVISDIIREVFTQAQLAAILFKL